MSTSLSPRTAAVYLARLRNSLQLANVRLQRLRREHDRLTTTLGASASPTQHARQRRERQQALVDALATRVEHFEGGV